METILKSASRTVTISPNHPTTLIGERINPTGKKKLAAALASGELDVVRQEAQRQVAAGADVLDVNVGAAGVDEVEMLPRAVRAVAEVVDVPLCLDSANVHALEAGLKAYRQIAPDARPLINSVNGEAERLAGVLPLVAEYGAAVIGLCMSDAGIPETAGGRLEIAQLIVERAAGLGISPEAIIIDCLALTVGADSSAATVTLGAIDLVRETLGVNMTLGASNVSFGLPEREVVNHALLAMAIARGVTAPIVDVARVRPAILAADLLLGRDSYGMRYIKAYKQRLKAAEAAAAG